MQCPILLASIGVRDAVDKLVLSRHALLLRYWVQTLWPPLIEKVNQCVQVFCHMLSTTNEVNNPFTLLVNEAPVLRVRMHSHCHTMGWQAAFPEGIAVVVQYAGVLAVVFKVYITAW